MMMPIRMMMMIIIMGHECLLGEYQQERSGRKERILRGE
jgi:hypothetical protein